MNCDLVVVGGGVMGLMTAYHASRRDRRVIVLERGWIGDPATASFGRTRSYRTDYLDARYARLAREAIALWRAFEIDTQTKVLTRCGCMNIAHSEVTPDVSGTYAHRSHATLQALGYPTESLGRDALRQRFPFLEADLAHIDLDGGVVDLAAVTATLLRELQARDVTIVEGAELERITPVSDGVRVQTTTDAFTASAAVVTAGHGTNDVLARADGNRLHVPLTRDRPFEARYFSPADPAPYNAAAMPVIAYLDAGIYCHPIIDGVVDKVKIGYYHPPDLPRTVTAIDGIDSFISRCMPGLADASSEPVADCDGCDYDLVSDDEFILGPIPGVPGASVGVGWRGTGYKFAPWVGRVLSQLALEGGTVYDISRFDPGRFTQNGGNGDGALLSSHPETAAP